MADSPKTMNDYSVLLYGPCGLDPECRFPDGHGGDHEPREEERPTDDPAPVIECDGRNCGGYPHG
jgi:hypothetical protein